MAANGGWKSSMNLGDGHRMTPQRREVYEVLMENQDHPTATEVFMRVKERIPAISLATVYNCLDTLSGAGFIIQVNVDREPSRYCGNLSPHGHFHCEDCGTILDVQLKEGVQVSKAVTLPRGAVVERFEVAVRGHCQECVGKRKAEARKSS